MTSNVCSGMVLCGWAQTWMAAKCNGVHPKNDFHCRLEPCKPHSVSSSESKTDGAPWRSRARRGRCQSCLGALAH